MFEAFENKNALAETLADAFPLHPLTFYALPRLAARLAQNERTVFSFVRDIALNETAGFSDLYRYFSGSMSTDTGIGGTYRRWLETESALSKANNEAEKEILSSSAILGFGVSGERARVKKSLLEFAVSGFQGLSRTDIRKTIENLIDRNLLLYRKRNDDVSVWHGTDVDIRGLLKEEIQKIESEFEAVDVLSVEYPAPNWRPVAHNVKNAVRRFFEGRYLCADELLRKGLSHPSLTLALEEDGRIIYCVAETQAEISNLLSYIPSTSATAPGIVFVVPEHPAQMLKIALEILALRQLQRDHDLIATDPFVLPELRYMADSAREDLDNIMRHFIRPGIDGSRWFSHGRRFRARNDRELCEKLSEIADERFPSTPRINNELVVRRQVSRQMVNARKKLVLGILERNGEPSLGFDREATIPDVTMYRTVLEKTGLYGFSASGWEWTAPEQLEDRNLAEVWEMLKRFFEVAGTEKSPSKELFQELEFPPYGLRRGVMPILVAAGLQAFGRAVVIKREGKYLPDILASEIEEFCASPEKFTVDVLEVNASLLLYLRELIEQFDSRQPVASGDLIRQFYDSLEFWKSQLPDQAMRTRYVSGKARSFQRILRKETNPAVIALKKFPGLAGTDGPDSGTSKFIGELRREIEGVVEGYVAKAISITREAFDFANGETQNTLDCAKTWSTCFDEESFDLSKLDSTCKAVFARAREATQGRYTEFSFVSALSFILLGKGFDKWDDTSPGEFASRLAETVRKLERAVLEEDSTPSELSLPLLDRYFHRVYRQLERMFGPRGATGRIRKLIEEKEKTNSGSFGGLKKNGTYEKSA